VKRKQLVKALRHELMYLWCDLDWAYRESRATPPEKSPGCEGLIDRIQRVSRLVGPISPDQVSMPFLLTGMFEQVHAAMGLEVTVPEATLKACREYVDSQRVGSPWSTRWWPSS
jgi:hypothetical protein